MRLLRVDVLSLLLIGVMGRETWRGVGRRKEAWEDVEKRGKS